MSLKNPVTPPGIGPETVRLVVQHLNHYASPGPYLEYVPASKLFDHAWFEVLEGLPLYCIWSDYR